jgi:hypothetical protein
MQQELLTAGPLYVSFLVFEDMFNPMAWTESGIYIHKQGKMIGKHAATVVGYGTDTDGRDYWLLLNSFGNDWQQEGYFKVMRGQSSLRLTDFGAWGVDWTHADQDNSKPFIVDVEVSFSPVTRDFAISSELAALEAVWLQVAAYTDEPAKMLIRVQGLENTVTGEMKDHVQKMKHRLKVDLLKLDLVGEVAKIQIWAVDSSHNVGIFGPYTFQIPSLQAFQESQKERRLATLNISELASRDSMDWDMEELRAPNRSHRWLREPLRASPSSEPFDSEPVWV